MLLGPPLDFDGRLFSNICCPMLSANQQRHADVAESEVCIANYTEHNLAPLQKAVQ